MRRPRLLPVLSCTTYFPSLQRFLRGGAALLPLLAVLAHCGGDGQPRAGRALPELATLPSGAQLMLSPSSPQIGAGTGQQFALRLQGVDGRQHDVSKQVRWHLHTEAGEELLAPSAGLVELAQPGRYRVSAELDGRQVSTPIFATTAAVRSVSVTPSLPKVPRGLSQQFRALAIMTDGTTQDVTSLSSWSVRDTLGTAVATVTSAGLATAKNLGKSRVAARYSLTSGSTTMEVTPAAISKLLIAPQDISIAKGTSASFTATATFSDGSVQEVSALCDWAVMDVLGSGVASIDGSGTATGEAVGRAKVSAEYLGQLSETTLTVTAAAVVGLSLSPGSASIAKGTTQRFVATARLSDGSSQDVSALVAWSASDVTGVGVASIDAMGLAKGNAVGSAQINAAYRGYTASAALEVKPAVLLSVALSPAMATVAKGRSQSFKLTASYSDGSTQDVTGAAVWTSVDVLGTDVAAVSAAGLALGKNVGQATIRGEHMGKNASASLTVGPAVLSSVSIVPSSVTIAIGGTQAFKAQASYSDGSSVDVTTMATWSIADIAPGSGVATISAGGLASGKSRGAATVTAVYMSQRGQATLAVGLPTSVCSASGWCWRNPLPQGNYLPSVWSLDANNAWAVSDFGVILKWNGATWLPQASGTTQNLLAVWGSDASNLWAVGVGGVIVKYNGSSWSVQSSGTTQSLSAVWGSDASNVWAVGASGVIVKWNGSSWTAQASGSSAYLRGIWGSDSSHVWAVGQNGTILRWDGLAWSAVSSGTLAYLRGIWGRDANTIWTVGLGGTILKWDGTAWTPQASGSSAYLRGIWGSSATSLFAVGEFGVILRGDGSSWTALSSGTSATLNSVFGSGPSDAWVVGNNGLILRWDGSSVSPRSSGSTNSSFGIWGSDSNNVWLVGDGGQILKWNGTSLSPQTSGTTQNLIAVWGSDARNLWAVGIGGAIQYWNGAAWSSQASGTTQNLLAVFGTSASNVVAAGAGGTLLSWNGSTWSALSSPTTSSLYGLWGSGTSDLWAVGAAGTALHFDGSSWSAVSTGSTSSLSAVWGSDASNVFAVGGLGTILRLNAGSWVAQISGTSQSLYGVWGSSASNVFSVGAGGTLLKWNGTAWTPQVSGSSQSLNAIFGTSSSNIWTAGAFGAVLQYAP